MNNEVKKKMSEIQNNNDLELCAGFMFIKSNKTTIDLFDTQDININNFKCDQPYINCKKDLS